MNEKEISAAALLLFIYQRAHQSAEALDPGRKRKMDFVMHFDRIIKESSEAFFMLTGRLPHTVRTYELNTVTPEPWVRDHKPEIY